MKGNGPKERLVATAIDLFYKQGYDATTVNQIIDVSATHKASFYRYFHDKEELGEKYLEIQGETFNNGWKYLMRKSESPHKFLSTWISLLKRQVRSGQYFGCPIAKYMISAEKPENSAAKANQILQTWTQTLTDYFDKCKVEGKLPNNFASQKIAIRFLKLFQGNSQFYIITGNGKYFEEMKQEMLEELDHVN